MPDPASEEYTQVFKEGGKWMIENVRPCTPQFFNFICRNGIELCSCEGPALASVRVTCMAPKKLLLRAQDKDVRPDEGLFLSGMPMVAVHVLYTLGPAPQPSLDHRLLSPIQDGLWSSLHPE